jgi:hypothetical protein
MGATALKYVSLENRRIITERRNCMADESQLSLFKQGVRAWNEWRREHQREIFEEQVDRLIRALSSEEHGSCRHRLNYNIVTTALRRRIDWSNLFGIAPFRAPAAAFDASG